MSLLDQSGVTGGGLDHDNVCMLCLQTWTTCGQKDLEITIVLFLSTKWVDYVEEPMKYQALRPHFFSVGWVGGGGVGGGGVG